MQRFKFTKKGIESEPTTNRRRYIYDTVVPQLGLTLMPSGTRSFHVRATVHGTTKRIALENGKYPGMKIEQARKAALAVLSSIADNQDPVSKRRELKASSITLREVSEQYLDERRDRHGRPLKPYTKGDYGKALNETFADYLDRPIADITEKVVIKQYKRRMGQSPARAGNAARVLSAIFNFARVRYKAADGKSFFPENPVGVIKELRLRYVAPRKKTYIQKGDLPMWFDTVERMDLTGYFKFLLLTGIRGGEVDRLRWEDLDFNNGSFRLIDTKNKEEVALPLPSTMSVILRPSQEVSGRVFNMTDEGRKLRAKVIAESGVQFTRHDLRRTFATVAEGLDISWLAVKRLMNHKTQEAGVTEGYVGVDFDRLRKASLKIESEILRYAGRINADVRRIHG